MLMVSPAPEGDVTVLTLDSLVQGFPHIPSEGGAMMAQAAMICLDHQAHAPSIRLVVDGDFTATFALSWSEEVTEPKRRFWNDLDEAVQQGAYAVAILLIRALTGYTVVERSRKGTGFDWWLGTDDNLFQGRHAWKFPASVGGPRGGSTVGSRHGWSRPDNPTIWR
jgi:hypothetical protein